MSLCIWQTRPSCQCLGLGNHYAVCSRLNTSIQGLLRLEMSERKALLRKIYVHLARTGRQNCGAPKVTR
jgi:hypothetical protein